MLIDTGNACDQQVTELELLTRQQVVLIANFMHVELRHSDAIAVIARHLHQRHAAFTRDGKPLNDYKKILDAVSLRDPFASH